VLRLLLSSSADKVQKITISHPVCARAEVTVAKDMDTVDTRKQRSPLRAECARCVGPAQSPWTEGPESEHILRDRLCDMARGPWLVILDNADDARVLLGTSSTSEQADKSAFNARLDCIPPCNNGQLLVTSRTAEAAKQLVDWNDMIVVEPMGKNQALTLLCNKLGTEYTKQDALQLARELDFMPLALTQAAAYIRQSAGRCTIRQYLEKLMHLTRVFWIWMRGTFGATVSRATRLC
jgi:hypothetical protein